MTYPQNPIPPFRYDYTKCMMMKLSMAYPEPKDTGRSHVMMNFEQALACIKQVDAMTPGITKIYYLVGWQYNGHDDRYPDFFEVNQALKRPGDRSARDSLLWLYEEAQKYHSVLSLHINFNDAYEDAPSFQRFRDAGALIRKKNGRPHAIERYNGKACYKTCFKGYWESGLFQEHIDKLLKLLPFLRECGTVHVDNFQCYRNDSPAVSITEMQEYRRRMIAHLKGLGIEITSEFTYKEDESLPNRRCFGLPREHHSKTPMATLGVIPASWWCTRMTRRELTEIPPQLYSGGLYRDKRYGKYLYGNMHGEGTIRPDRPGWTQAFLHEFATLQVPYHFLCTHQRLRISGYGPTEKCVFSDGIVSACRNQAITQNGTVLKEKNTLFLPYVHQQNCYFAYSEKGDERDWKLQSGDSKTARLYAVTEAGVVPQGQAEINRQTLHLKIEPGAALLVFVSAQK